MDAPVYWDPQVRFMWLSVANRHKYLTSAISLAPVHLIIPLNDSGNTGTLTG